MVAVAKALADSARETRVLEIRGGVMQGRTISAADVEELAKLPPLDVLRGQVLGAVIAPLSASLALVERAAAEPIGLIDARDRAAPGAGRSGEAAPETQGGGEARPHPVSDESSQTEETPAEAAPAEAEPAAAVSDESSSGGGSG